MENNFIKAKMQECGMRPQQLAEYLNISEPAYYYKQKHGAWTPVEIIQLSKLFNCTTDYLLKGE